MADVVEMTAEQKAAEFKAKKAEAAKRFKERRKAERLDNIAQAQKLIDQLKKDKLYDKISDESKAFLDRLAKPVQQGVANVQSIFSKLFGTEPKVGASFTLLEVVEKTEKGKADIDKLTKKWATEGYIVEFVPNASKLIESKYVLKEIKK